MKNLYLLSLICVTLLLSACSQSSTPKKEVTFSAPKISKIELRSEQNSVSGKIVYIDAFYTDSDGDATIIDLEIVSTTGTNTFVSDGILSAGSASQKSGAVQTSTWTCGLNQVYEVVVSFQIKDAKDKVSELVEQKIVCD